MSRENVELTKQGYEAFARGDFERLFTWLDPEIDWDVSRRLIDPGRFHGHQGVREFLRRQGEVWGGQRIEAEEFIEAGEDLVVVPIRFVSTGRASGIDVVARAAWVWEIRNGVAVRATLYQSKAQALEAAGVAK
ncbi:MAG: nuclear transport factor 2 family protein [Solirubrobacteraceae bacterium]